MLKCDLCGGIDFAFLCAGHDRVHGVPGEFSVMECAACGLSTIDPKPSGPEMGRFYPQREYYAMLPARSDSGIRPWLYRTLFSRDGSRLLRGLLAPFRMVMRSTHLVEGGRLLDLGCGSGQFLYMMQGLGMEAHGIEPGDFDEESAAAHGLRIFHGDLTAAAFPAAYFDVITANHVLEHLPSPTGALDELHRLLKPEGTLIVGVPQKRCLAYWLFRDCWVQLDVPRHLHTFSTETIAACVKKAGFTIEGVRFNSKPFQFAGSLLYWSNRFRRQEKLLKNSRMESRFWYAALYPLAAVCNLLRVGDQVEVVATKPSV